MRIPERTPGETVRIGRIRLGLTQQQLADLLNADLPPHEIIERSMISRWEKDLHFPRNARKTALEKHLGIKIGDPPPRLNNFAAYTANPFEINKSLEIGLNNCDELWISNTAGGNGIWEELPSSKRIFDRLRKSHGSQFRELIYIRDLKDLKKVTLLAEKGYPRYRIRVRLSPAHPLPLLLAPGKKFGLMLSGFSDEIANVGLELNGQIASFVEHYFRHLWDRATPILESDGVQYQAVARVEHVLSEYGGTMPINFRND